MTYQTIPLPDRLSLGGSLTLYIQDTHPGWGPQKHPMVLLCPGGGYGPPSLREGEPLALAFLAMGCHVAVLSYSPAPARYPTQLIEAAYAMNYLRQHTEEWHIDPEKFIVAGCSAGGHLAANLGTAWQEEWLAKEADAPSNEFIKPNGMILCYPVITGGEHRNIGSFEALLGESNTPQEREKHSLETKVTKSTPPTILWHTCDDTVVPVENSLLFISALKKQ
ncbi:MAG: alpha/beta hydrolase, partial [Clostridia bacterium]|nr:alpha/beta hydrolase [Clostridia bacterium]